MITHDQVIRTVQDPEGRKRSFSLDSEAIVGLKSDGRKRIRLSQAHFPQHRGVVFLRRFRASSTRKTQSERSFRSSCSQRRNTAHPRSRSSSFTRRSRA